MSKLLVVDIDLKLEEDYKEINESKYLEYYAKYLKQDMIRQMESLHQKK